MNRASHAPRTRARPAWIGRVAIAAGVAAACFAAGMVVGRGGGSRGDDLGVPRGGEPALLFDASAIRLLPDADLVLRPIVVPDAGADAPGR